MKTIKFTISEVEPVSIFGFNEENLRRIEEEFSSRIVVRGDEVTIRGKEEEVEMIRLLRLDLVDQSRKGHFCTQDDVRYSLQRIKKREESPPVTGLRSLFSDIFAESTLSNLFVLSIVGILLVMFVGPSSSTVCGVRWRLPEAGLSALVWGWRSLGAINGKCRRRIKSFIVRNALRIASLEDPSKVHYCYIEII